MSITLRVAQPGHVQTVSIRDLFGLHPGETLFEAKL